MASDGSRSPVSAALAERFHAVRERSERLCRPLEPDDYGAQSMPDASPAKWHLAHTTWFFESFVLREADAGYAPFREGWAFLFNSYYEAEGSRQPRERRGLQTRPTVKEVLDYRRAIDERIGQALRICALPSGLLERVELGLNHEEQHQELLLTDLLHLFAQNALETRYAAGSALPCVAQPRGWLRHPGGLCQVGHAGEGFAFDNEGPAHRIHLEPFELATTLVSNAEYVGFIEDGGYARPELWLSEGWARVAGSGWQAPLYWRRQAGGWREQSLHGSAPLDPAAPVRHVSYYEAEAFARWADARLPREEEWELLAREHVAHAQFLDERVFVPRPTPSLLGSTWVWTASPYTAYPGYRPERGALGEYNGKFMCSQLVLRGGSCFTPPGHARATYRNFFYPDARWQVSGIRLARS